MKRSSSDKVKYESVCNRTWMPWSRLIKRVRVKREKKKHELGSEEALVEKSTFRRNIFHWCFSLAVAVILFHFHKFHTLSLVVALVAVTVAALAMEMVKDEYALHARSLACSLSKSKMFKFEKFKWTYSNRFRSVWSRSLLLHTQSPVCACIFNYISK